MATLVSVMSDDAKLETKDLRVSVSISRRVNLGNYEGAEVFLSLNGIAPGTTAEEMEQALATGALGYDAVKAALKDKIKDVRMTLAVGELTNGRKATQ